METLTVSEQTWHRIEVQHYATVNDFGEVDGRYATVRHIKYEVTKLTPKGAWLRIPFNGKKFVLREMQHRGRAFAAPTVEQAADDFRARKAFQIGRLQSQINRANKELALVEAYYPCDTSPSPSSALPPASALGSSLIKETNQ